MLNLVKYAAKQTFQSFFLGYKNTFTDLPELNGEVWLVTGSTSGIGTEIAKILVAHHAKVILVGRSEQKLQDTIDIIKKAVPETTPDLETMLIDYNDIHTIEPAVNKLKQSITHLDGIVHNAGVMNTPKGVVTKQGIEATFGINNIATQYLQNLLDPLIENQQNSRIVWLSSLAHAFAPYTGFDASKISTSSPPSIYAASKALDYIQSVQWSKNHPNSPTMSVSVHPGIIKSNLSRTTESYMTFMAKYLTYDTPYGALSPIFAMLSPEVENNDYIVPFGRRGVVRPDIYDAARNEAGAEHMKWINQQITETLNK